MNKKILIGLAIMFAASGSGILLRFFLNPIAVPSEPLGGSAVQIFAFVPAHEEIQNSTTLMFVGDIMLDRGVKGKIMKYGVGDFKFPFLKIQPYLSKANVLFGNLEGPLSDKGADLNKTYSFRMATSSVNGLRFAGFKALSLANNHSDDWGRIAEADTRTWISRAGILPIGTGTAEEAYAPQIEDLEDVKIAYLAFADFKWMKAGTSTVGVAFPDDSSLKQTISLARSQADLVVVSFHFGEEYKKDPVLRQRSLAEKAIDMGADLVVGHHPHVVGPLEVYNGKYIAYSLGNFVFDQFFSKDTMEGAVLEVSVSGKKIESAKLTPVKINKFFQPELE